MWEMLLETFFPPSLTAPGPGLLNYGPSWAAYERLEYFPNTVCSCAVHSDWQTPPHWTM